MKKNTFKSSQPSYQVLCVICVAILLSGCTRVSLQSVRDPSFSNPINKLFIIVNQVRVDSIDPSYTPYLTTALKDEFSKEGVELFIRSVNPLALDTNAYKSEIASYKPDGVLIIAYAGGTRAGTSSGILDILYDVSLFDSSMSKRVWRAQIKASGPTNAQKKRMKLVARDLVKELREKKLISSESRIKGK